MDKDGDTGNAFAFRKLGSDGNGGNEKSGNAGDGNSSAPIGFINPEIARTTTGNATPDPGAAPGPAASGPVPGKRGRHPATCTCPKCLAKRAGQKQESGIGVKINVSQDILIFAHTIAASTFKLPELEITTDEAAQIATALENIDQRIAVQVDPRTKAIYDLCRVLGTVYGTRAIAIYMRKQAEKKNPQKPATPAAPAARPAPAPAAPVMAARETVPARPAPPAGEDQNGINDPLLHAVFQAPKKPNGGPVIVSEDAPMLDAFAQFDPTKIKVMN